VTYYEELGLDRNASVEEIRHAYRRLARLVHPDQCADAETRRLAELQMTRLNAVLAVLTDPQQRIRYNASLTLAIAGPLPVMLQRQALYVGAGLLALIAIAAALRPQRPVPAKIATASAPAVQAPPPRKNVRQTQPLAIIRPRPKVDVLETPEIGPPVVHVPADPLPTIVPPVLPVTTPPIEAAAPIPAPAPRLTGRWLFAASQGIKEAGYPPEYIELRLNETGGLLRGLYQARYRVTDRAISPNVAFRFEGPAEADGGVLPWQGPGGSKGEVTLRLLPTGGLEVDWVAHQLGRELGLISGTATLVRKME
jgi:DnaJ domain